MCIGFANGGYPGVDDAEFPLRGHLNAAQWQAASAGDGHLVINAAAGTGKTTTIAARILYLQRVRRVPREAILAVSFSRAARANLLTRLEQLVAEVGQGSPVRTLTLHGLSYWIIRLAAAKGETWLRDGFEVLASGRDTANPLWVEEEHSLIGDLRDGLERGRRCEIYAAALDLLRQGRPGSDDAVLLGPEDLKGCSGYVTIPFGHGDRAQVSVEAIARVWQRYDGLLRQRKCIDYPGMVSESLRLLYEDGDAARTAKRGLRYLIVDEFQDTSKAHMDLIRLLADEQAFVNAVGDDDQAIYTFNGSDVQNIQRFQQHMSDGPQPLLPAIHLTENYRSSPNILHAANRVLAHAGRKVPKRLRPAAGILPQPVQSYRERDLDVVCVQAASRERAAVWAAAEIKRLITEEQIDPSEIAVLVRKDTDYSPQGRLVREALAAMDVETHAQVRDPQRASLVLAAARQLCQMNPTESMVDLQRQVVAGRYTVELAGFSTAEVNAVMGESVKAGAQLGYEAAELLWDQGAPEQTPPTLNGVQVRTVHSAKGLEFRIVFLLYVADREFPSGTIFDEPEERRLYYVGVTRAQERLYVLGRRGILGPSFFEEVAGAGPSQAGVALVQAESADRAAPPLDSSALSPETRLRIEETRERQQQLDRERQRKAREEAEWD